MSSSIAAHVCFSSVFQAADTCYAACSLFVSWYDHIPGCWLNHAECIRVTFQPPLIPVLSSSAEGRRERELPRKVWLSRTWAVDGHPLDVEARAERKVRTEYRGEEQASQ